MIEPNGQNKSPAWLLTFQKSLRWMECWKVVSLHNTILNIYRSSGCSSHVIERKASDKLGFVTFGLTLTKKFRNFLLVESMVSPTTNPNPIGTVLTEPVASCEAAQEKGPTVYGIEIIMETCILDMKGWPDATAYPKVAKSGPDVRVWTASCVNIHESQKLQKAKESFPPEIMNFTQHWCMSNMFGFANMLVCPNHPQIVCSNAEKSF